MPRKPLTLLRSSPSFREFVQNTFGITNTSPTQGETLADSDSEVLTPSGDDTSNSVDTEDSSQ